MKTRSRYWHLYMCDDGSNVLKIENHLITAEKAMEMCKEIFPYEEMIVIKPLSKNEAKFIQDNFEELIVVNPQFQVGSA